MVTWNLTGDNLALCFWDMLDFMSGFKEGVPELDQVKSKYLGKYNLFIS